jgi:hypothetical protein
MLDDTQADAPPEQELVMLNPVIMPTRRQA